MGKQDCSVMRRFLKSRTQIPRSFIHVATPNGHGSTNTAIRRFSASPTASAGEDITYADSAANGGSFTINKTGIYAVNYTDRHNTDPANMGISRNSSELTTSIASIAVSNRMAYQLSGSGGLFVAVAAVIYCDAGDVIRAHTDGSLNYTGNAAFFRITRIA